MRTDSSRACASMSLAVRSSTTCFLIVAGDSNTFESRHRAPNPWLRFSVYAPDRDQLTGTLGTPVSGVITQC